MPPLYRRGGRRSAGWRKPRIITCACMPERRCLGPGRRNRSRKGQPPGPANPPVSVRLHRGEYVGWRPRTWKKPIWTADSLGGRVRCQLALGRLSQAMTWLEQADKVLALTRELVRACAQVLRLAQRRKVVAQGLQAPPERAEGWDAAIDRFVCAEQAFTGGRLTEEVESLLEGAFVKRVEIGDAYGLRALLALEKGRLSRALADAGKGDCISPQGTSRLLRPGPGSLGARQRRGTGRPYPGDDAEPAKGCRDPSLAGRSREPSRPQDRSTGYAGEAAKLNPKDKEIAEQLRAFQSEKGPKDGPR